MPITTITLDAAGTLIQTARPVSDTYLRLAKTHGAQLDAGALARGFREAYIAMPPMAFANASDGDLEQLERNWWRRLVRTVTDRAGGVTAFDDYFSALYEHYAGGAAWTLYPEVISVLDTLTARGYRLAVISNFDSRLLGVLTDLGVSDYFHSIICSTVAGAAKPDAAIFRKSLEHLSVSPLETLHVGDNNDADFAGARAVDMHALLLRRDATSAGAHEAVDLRGIWRYLAQHG